MGLPHPGCRSRPRRCWGQTGAGSQGASLTVSMSLGTGTSPALVSGAGLSPSPEARAHSLREAFRGGQAGRPGLGLQIPCPALASSNN